MSEGTHQHPTPKPGGALGRAGCAVARAVALAERFVSLQVVCGLIPYSTRQLGFHPDQAAILNLGFLGISTLAPALGGWLAVSRPESRPKLLCVCSSCLHVLGTILLSALAFPGGEASPGPGTEGMAAGTRTGLLLTALLATSLGTGGTQAIACLPKAHVAQQRGTKERRPLRSWRRWLEPLEPAGLLLGVSCTQHWGVSRPLLPTMSVLSALATLCLACHPRPPRPERARSLHTTLGLVCVHPPETTGPRPSPSSPRGPAAEGWGRDFGVQGRQRRPLPGLLPLLVCQLLHRMCVLQVPAAFFLQSMNSDWSWGGRLLPVAVLGALGSLPCAVLGPVLDGTWAGLQGSGAEQTFLRVCTLGGLVAGALALGVAGLVEMRRKLFPEVVRRCPGGEALVSSMPGAHLLPQYLLLGLADALARPADSLVTRRGIPGTLRGEASGILLPLFHGLACFSTALLVESVYLLSEGAWFPAPLNSGRLEGFLFSLAALTLLSLLGFWKLPPRPWPLRHGYATGRTHREETPLLLLEKSRALYGSLGETRTQSPGWPGGCAWRGGSWGACPAEHLGVSIL